MEQQRYYLRVGVFVSLALVIAISVLGWFAAGSNKQTYTTYAIYFSGAVDGVSLGAPVRLKGITVGSVKDISFVKDSDQVVVLVDIMSKAPIRNDTAATLQLQGITGGSVIALNNSGKDPTPKVAQPGQEYPVIDSTPSQFEKVLSSVPELIEEAKQLAERGQKLLSDDNIAQVNGALKSIDETSKSLQGLATAIDSKHINASVNELNEALVEAKLTLREVRMLARELRDDPSMILYGIKHEGKKVQ